ncbi:MAG: hypothetical protein IPM98_19160 [Lewinellaceae bacterium]|nr:hypothetical protein [Lewinellaceae bacterium]
MTRIRLPSALKRGVFALFGDEVLNDLPFQIQVVNTRFFHFGNPEFVVAVLQTVHNFFAVGENPGAKNAAIDG